MRDASAADSAAADATLHCLSCCHPAVPPPCSASATATFNVMLLLPLYPSTCNANPASLDTTLPCLLPTSKVPGRSPCTVLLRDSPNHLPCHLCCVGVGIRQMHSRGGDTSMPIRSLTFASDVVGGSNAASKHCGADPSIASTSAAYNKRRGGHVDRDDGSSTSLLPARYPVSY